VGSTADASRSIRVAIIDPEKITRSGLRLIIDESPGFHCTQVFETVDEGMRGLRSGMPDVLLLDIHLAGSGPSDGVRLIRRSCPSMHILMLSYLAGDERVLRSILDGAHGYVLKMTSPGRLLEAISDAAAGGAPLSPEIARGISGLLKRMRLHRQVANDLNPNERRLLELFAQGYGFQGAAEQLAVGTDRIRDWATSIYEKLHCHWSHFRKPDV